MSINYLGSGLAPDLIREHVVRLAASLHEAGLTAAILFHPSNMLAFAGTTHSASDRLVLAIVPASRDAAGARVEVICPAFEAPAIAGETNVPELHTWQESDDAYALTARRLRECASGPLRVVLDDRTWLSARRDLARALSDAEVIDDESIISKVRLIKSAAEQEALREAARAGQVLFHACAERLRPDVSERELRDELTELMAARGVRAAPMVQTGANAAIPHHVPGDARLSYGDLVVVDSVTATAGYISDITRTFAVSPPDNAKARDAYAAVRAAQRAAIDAAKPGITCGALDRIARDVISSAGFGEYFVHRLGHGIGIEVHEPPYLVAGSPQSLNAGMCATIEPGIYIPGEFGIRIEDDVLITHSGCEVLGDLPTDLSPSLAEIP